MPYSHLPIPNIPSTRIIDTDTYIYIAPPNHPAGKTGSAGSWTGATFGDDGTGDGTLSRPYATLRKAWQKAQEYIIQGNARVYIQFQKGIYGYTFSHNNRAGTNPFPDVLYHPQGNRIIIQGDPEATRQRYLYRVKDYSWDFSRMAYYGHTGTVNLWYGQHAYGLTAHSSLYPSGGGTTDHGFTAQDEMGYVSIFNAAQSTITNRSYIDPYNGVNTNNKYSRTSGSNWFRSHLNHGLSYEEAKGIHGLARIENASASVSDLRLQFKNFNIDTRIGVYPGGNTGGRLGGGLGNALAFAGAVDAAGTIGSNYPEPQYSVPNGYYGPTFGVNEDTTLVTPGWGTDNSVVYGQYPSAPVVNMTYPARLTGTPTEVHVTDDPHVLTTFPVVIKVYSDTSTSDTNLQKPVPFFLDDSVVGSIRNLMIVNGDMEARSYTVLPQGGTHAPIHMIDYASGNGTDTSYRSRSPAGLILRNGSKTKIRNFGMLGWGVGLQRAAVIVTDASTLEADFVFEENSFYTTQGLQLAGSDSIYAELGGLHNTPVLVTSHGGGMQCDKDSTITFSESFDGSIARAPKSISYALNHTWIQTAPGLYIPDGIRADTSTLNLASTTVNNYSFPPGYTRLCMNIPVFPGATVFGGVTAMFMHGEPFGAGRGSTYCSIIAYSVTSSGRTPFARITHLNSYGDTFASVTSPAGDRVGWSNGTVAVSSGSAPAAATIQNQPTLVYGVLLTKHQHEHFTGLKDFINRGTGNTMEFYVYHDAAEGVTGTSYYAVGKNGCVFRTPAGITVTVTESGAGATNGFYFPSIASNPKNQLLTRYYNGFGYGMYTRNTDITHTGILDIGGKNYVAMYLMSDSSFYGRNSLVHVKEASHTNIIVENSTWNSVDGNCSLLTRHCNPFGKDDVGNLYTYPLYICCGAQMAFWGGIVAIGVPLARRAVTLDSSFGSGAGGHGVGLWEGVTGNSALTIDGVFNKTSGAFGVPLRLSHGAELSLSGNESSEYPCILGYDGGVDSAHMYNGTNSTTNKGHEATMYHGAKLYENRSLMHFWNVMQQGPAYSSVSGTPGIMTRAPYGIDSSQGQQLLYNAPRGASMWFIAYPQGTGKTRNSAGYYGTLSTFGKTTNSLSVDRIDWRTGDAASQYSYGQPIELPNNPQINNGATGGARGGYSGPGIMMGNGGALGLEVSTSHTGRL